MNNKSSCRSSNNSKKSRLTNKIQVATLILFACLFATLSNKTSTDKIQPFFTSVDSIVRMQQNDYSTVRNLRQPSVQTLPIRKYQPINCHELIQRALTTSSDESTDIIDPNNGVLHGKQVELNPKFWISLHNEQFDPTRWGIWKYGYYYENKLSAAFQEVLSDKSSNSNNNNQQQQQQQQQRPARVLDVGGNIGFFTLLSAANGPVTVDVWEPNEKNRLRMCESLQLNDWHGEYDTTYGQSSKVSQVNLYPYGIGRKEGNFSFTEHLTNPGQGLVQETTAEKPNEKSLQVITLDNFAEERGWFESRPDIAILKVDVEGFEYSVIEGAHKLLKAKIVRNVFMEVSAREKEEIELNKPPIQFLGKSGYKLHKVGGWMGPTRELKIPEDVDMADYIMQETLKEEAKQLNLWWKLA